MNNNIKMEWIILKIHWKNFDVKIWDNYIATLNLKWKLKKNKIQFVEWDKVEVELNNIDPSKGYITKRL